MSGVRAGGWLPWPELALWPVAVEYRNAATLKSVAENNADRPGVMPSLTLPVGCQIVLQEMPPHVLSRVYARDDGIDDARGAVHGVERRVKALLGALPLGDLDGVLVGDPSCVDAVHMD